MDFAVLRAVLRNLVLPPTGPLLLAVAGLLIARRERFRRAGRAVASAGLILLWLLATPAVSQLLVRWGERYPSLDLSAPVAADAIVILGGGARRTAPEYGNAAPTQLTLQRMAYGARVARLTGLPVLVTGEHEGQPMAEFLREDFGVVPRWVETRARNTRENAAYSAALLKASGVRTIVLVTSALHMPRAVSEFVAHELEVVPAPVNLSERRPLEWSDFVPGFAALGDSHAVLYELLGRVEAALRR